MFAYSLPCDSMVVFVLVIAWVTGIAFTGVVTGLWVDGELTNEMGAE